MSVSRMRMGVRAFALVVLLGVTTNAAADNCGFAYGFCMPLYYGCLAEGGHPPECHALLDQCILINGCTTLP